MSVDSNVVKVALIGMNNAGKTTLLRTIQHRIKAGENLAPTRSIERNQFELFGESGSIWDYGGQKQYRENYLAKPHRYFSDIRYLFFVIDIQDPASFPDALQYYKEVVEHTKSLTTGLIVSVLFHKADPNSPQKAEIEKRIELLSKEIARMSEGAEVGFYRTSVFDPFSIITAFSKPILGNQPIYNIVSMMFADFAMEHSLNYMSLVVNDFELGSFHLKDGYEQFISAGLEFYSQSKNINPDEKISYVIKEYSFKAIAGNVGKYHFMLYFAYRLDAVDKEPAPDDLTQLVMKIDEQFEKNPPKLE